MVGEDGMVARMGGEEFAVVVNTGDARHGFALVERIRTTTVNNHPFTSRASEEEVRVGRDYGGAEPAAGEALTPDIGR